MTASTATKQNSAEKPLRKKHRKLPYPLSIYQSAVGKKWIMALTGAMLLGFVFFHMLGNMKLYLGIIDELGIVDYDVNIYGHYLREILVPILPTGVFLIIARGILIVAVVLHILAAYSLTKMNLQSNQKYQSKRDWIAVNFASRTMRYSGVIVLFFILFHLADLTAGITGAYDFVEGNVQSNVVNSFSNPLTASFYIIANTLLALHIFHGAYSMFQSLGISNPRINYIRKPFATGLALLIWLGNISFPIAVLVGILNYNECPDGVTPSRENNCISAELYDEANQEEGII